MNFMFQPGTKTLNAGNAFRASAPGVWNCLFSDLTDLHSLNVFDLNENFLNFLKSY